MALVARDAHFHVPMHCGLLLTTMGVSMVLLHLRCTVWYIYIIGDTAKESRVLAVYLSCSHSWLNVFTRKHYYTVLQTRQGVTFLEQCVPHPHLKIRYGVPWLTSTRSIRCLPQRCVLSLCAVCAGD